MKRTYIPSNFNFEETFPNDTKHKDKYCYILHKIYEERVLNKEYSNNSYVRLSTKILETIIGKTHCKRIITNLLNEDIIETDRYYLPGIKSKGYKFTQKYNGCKCIQTEITDQKIIERITKFKNRQIKNIPQNNVYEILFSNVQKIEIDYYGAKQYINEQFLYDYDRYNSYSISLDYIYRKDFFFVVDKTASRVHTNITNLSKDLRPYLKYKGRKLVNIDISNSQPFLFNILIYNYINITPYVPDFNKKASNTVNKHVFSNMKNTFSPDIGKYLTLTKKGKFYEYLMENFDVDIKDRQEFKKNFFGKIFFSKNSEKYIYKEKKLFKKLFPFISQIIYYYKSNDYKNLAIQLQRVEADIIINRISRRIVEEKPDCFISTIHDSILTTRKNIKYVSHIIRDEFKKIFNLYQKIKIEYY